MIGPSFVMHYLVAFPFGNHLAEEEITGCFIFIVFLLLSIFGALCLFLTVSWAGLECLIVTFPGHTFFYYLTYITHDSFSPFSYIIYLSIVIITLSQYRLLVMII